MNIRRYFPVFNAPDAPSGPSGDTAISGETSVPGDSSPGDDFAGLDFGGDDFDTVEIDAAAAGTPHVPPSAGESPSPAPAAASPTPPAAPAAAPAATSPAAAPAAAAPPPAPAAQTPPQAPAPQDAAAQTQPPASVPADPAQMLEMLQTNQAEVIKGLAGSPQFALSQDEATLLETNPAQAVPQILARTYYHAVNATLAHINNLVPNMIDRHMKFVKAQGENEDAFYGKFPMLDRTKHGQDVAKFAQIIKAQNQSMTKDDFFAMIGAAVMAKHGLHGVAAAPAASPGAPAPTVIPATPPFAPAAPGASVRTTPVEEHPFAGLGQEWDS